MLFSLDLLELLPLEILYLYFFIIFCAVITLGYPFGRYVLCNYCENSLIKNSIFSITVFAALISILMNLAPILSKYVIIIFFLLNLSILAISSNIRKDFFRAIISFKFAFLITLLAFLVANIVFVPFEIENSNLIFFFDTHHTYYWDPIYEIFTADYFSRIKIASLYPAEWSSFHFLQAGFHSILVSPIYLSGSIGLLTLKIFYLSLVFSLFVVSFFNEDRFKSEKKINNLLKISILTLIFILLFHPKVLWLVFSNGALSAILFIFVVQSILSKSKKDLIIWSIILSISSFRNGLISLMLVIYFLIDSEVINFNVFFNKIKKSFNLPNVLLAILFLIYFFASFYQSKVSIHHPAYTLATSKHWWVLSTTDHIIQNYQSIILIFILFAFIYIISKKYFYKEKIPTFTKSKKIDFLYFISVLIIPLGCMLILFFKSQLFDIVDAKKLEIYFDQFNLTNLLYFFFVPLAWCFILVCSKTLERYIFILTIIGYTFLSLFIYNAITLPGIFIIELIVFLLTFQVLFSYENASREKIFSYLLMTSLVVSIIFSSSTLNIYFKEDDNQTFEKRVKLIFNIKEIKELQKKGYLCPQDIKSTNINDYSSALSSILIIPYYTHLEIAHERRRPEIASADFAIPPKIKQTNPCTVK